MTDERGSEAFAKAAGGVELSRYATVIALQGEDIPLEDALDHAGIDARVWPDAERAWTELLAGTTPESEAALAAFDAALDAAHDRLGRRISPLDEDLAVWLDFLRRWSSSADPLAMLEALGLGMGDVMRLQRAWAKRLEADAALREQAGAMLQREPAELPPIVAEPLALGARDRPPPPAPEATREVEARMAPPLLAALPIEGEDDAPPRPPPPRPEPQPQLHERPRPAAPATGPALGLSDYAALCAALSLFPARREELFAQYGLSTQPARDLVDRVYRERLSKDPEAYQTWQRLYLQHQRRLATQPGQGATSPEAPPLVRSATSPSLPTPQSPALPFHQASGAVPHAARGSAPSDTPPRRATATDATVTGAKRPLGATLPFQAAGRPETVAPDLAVPPPTGGAAAAGTESPSPARKLNPAFASTAPLRPTPFGPALPFADAPGRAAPAGSPAAASSGSTSAVVPPEPVPRRNPDLGSTAPARPSPLKTALPFTVQQGEEDEEGKAGRGVERAPAGSTETPEPRPKR